MSNAVPLPAATTLGKSFERGIDINLGTYAAPQWQPLRRASGINTTHPKTTADVATYDDRGAANEDVVGRSFASAVTVQGNRSLNTGMYLPELELLLAAAKAKGEGAVVDIREYHKPDVGVPHPTDAERVQVTVEANRQNTGNSETEVWAFTFAGKGEGEPIENPFQGWDVTTPSIAAVSPAGQGDGELVTITGAGLLGATAVTIDGDPSPEFEVVNGATIVAIVPIGDAGTVPVVVTTPGGASPSYAYTRGA